MFELGDPKIWAWLRPLMRNLAKPLLLVVIQGQSPPYALADAYAAGGAAAGHDVIRIEVVRLDFPVLRTRLDSGKRGLQTKTAGLS